MIIDTIDLPANTSRYGGLLAAQLPVFFVQLGNHANLFFDYVLKQAEASNGKENVYVLTDTNFHLYTAYNCIDVSKYMHGRHFDALYRHHSTNKYFFEKTCFDRWFIINDLIKDLGITNFFHADCDVLILEDLKPFYTENLEGKYAGSMMYFEDGNRSITSGHSSFWTSRLLEKFCAFVCEKYADEQAFNKILTDAQAGVFYDNTNVSDMILLDVFRREQQTPTLNLFTLEGSNSCFDFNINASYNGGRHHFKMSPVYKIKQIKLRQNGAYGRTLAGEKTQYLKFYTLHFQGYLTKALIPLHVTYHKGADKFNSKLLAERNFIIRKLRLSKNKLKGFVLKLAGK